jgi:hypothetical protein
VAGGGGEGGQIPEARMGLPAGRGQGNGAALPQRNAFRKQWLREIQPEKYFLVSHSKLGKISIELPGCFCGDLLNGIQTLITTGT